MGAVAGAAPTSWDGQPTSSPEWSWRGRQLAGLPLAPLGKTAPHEPRAPGPAACTLVWTMPGRWSLRCSRVAAMSISLAPATDTHRSQTGAAHAGEPHRCQGLWAQWPDDGDVILWPPGQEGHFGFTQEHRARRLSFSSLKKVGLKLAIRGRYTHPRRATARTN